MPDATLAAASSIHWRLLLEAQHVHSKMLQDAMSDYHDMQVEK